MKNLKVEVEGGELALKNSFGDIVIIPKKNRLEVEGMIKDKCWGCIDAFVDTLPVMEDYAEDGSLFPDWDKVKTKLNPKNWGVTDYTDKFPDKDKAFAAARKAGEKEYLYKNVRYTTDYAGTPQQQLKETGITNEQMLKQNIIRKRLSENMSNEYFVNNEYGLTSPIKRVVNAVVYNKKEDRSDNIGGDALNMYLGKPQTNNTFKISKYRPSKETEKNTNYYYGINDDEFIRNVLLESEKQQDEVFQMNDIYGRLGTFTVNRGEDARGKYISYYDKYDINPYKGVYSPFNSKKEDISMGIGKPYEIYDRIYYTNDKEKIKNRESLQNEYDILRKKQDEYNKYQDNFEVPKGFTYEQFKKLSDDNYEKIRSLQNKLLEDEKKPNLRVMYYSDKELSELDVNKKNFDTLALQKELANRGVKFEKSIKKDGSFDGIFGEETKAALLDYQTKNKKK
jgi:hypothetical protein